MVLRRRQLLMGVADEHPGEVVVDVEDVGQMDNVKDCGHGPAMTALWASNQPEPPLCRSWVRRCLLSTNRLRPWARNDRVAR